MFYEEKVFLEISQNSQENTCARVSFFNKVAGLRPVTLLKKESPAQVFSCEFFEISKNTFFYRKPLVAAFEDRMRLMKITAFQSVIFLADILGHITRRKKNHNKFI